MGLEPPFLLLKLWSPSPRVVSLVCSKVHLQPGASSIVERDLKSHHFAVPDPTTGAMTPILGAWRVWVGNRGQDKAALVHVIG